MDGMHPYLRSALGLFREATAPAAESLWWGPPGGLYWCNSAAGTLHFSALGSAISGTDDRTLRLPSTVAAFAPAGRGFVVAGVNAVAIVNEHGVFVRPLARVEHADDHIRFNEGKCDPYGRFIVATAGTHGFSNGTIYSIEPSGEWRVLYTGAGLVTGMQWSDDGSRIWFTDSRQSAILTAEYSPYGEMSNVREFVRGVAGEGLARDAHGGFWTGSGGGGKIARWDPAGQLSFEMDIPAKRVSSLAFGGDELSTLFIATSRVGLSEAALNEQPLTGSIFGIETATRGFPTRPFALI